ncbi:hypothetical protein [Polaromonas sp.]|uniref:hypothetical protein n=1 Tax=Polaromonas sp. TaxID=1869339 RepID=UPI002488215F|nr:hypothetical protein [Polaromonas sp.]MDI1272349.1 hypothetical protein [Polaromonas sp.]
MSATKDSLDYLVDAIHLDGGVVDQVALCDQNEKDPARRHRSAPVGEIVALIKARKKVATIWYDHNLPDHAEGNGCLGIIPLEVVTLADGSESIEVEKRGQSEDYQSIFKLPTFDQHWNTPGYFEKHGAIRRDN